jgi:hypothetical protein
VWESYDCKLSKEIRVLMFYSVEDQDGLFFGIRMAFDSEVQKLGHFLKLCWCRLDYFPVNLFQLRFID